jgi:hypothetical protein
VILSQAFVEPELQVNGCADEAAANRGGLMMRYVAPRCTCRVLLHPRIPGGPP